MADKRVFRGSESLIHVYIAICGWLSGPGICGAASPPHRHPEEAAREAVRGGWKYVAGHWLCPEHAVELPDPGASPSKSCPFCRSHDLSHRIDNDQLWISCCFCQCDGPVAHSVEEAETLWDTRPKEINDEY
jgi:hypothetical protein